MDDPILDNTNPCLICKSVEFEQGLLDAPDAGRTRFKVFNRSISDWATGRGYGEVTVRRCCGCGHLDLFAFTD